MEEKYKQTIILSPTPDYKPTHSIYAQRIAQLRREKLTMIRGLDFKKVDQQNLRDLKIQLSAEIDSTQKIHDTVDPNRMDNGIVVGTLIKDSLKEVISELNATHKTISDHFGDD